MPAQQPVEFVLPKKGVKKNPSWSESIPEFTVDALNVLPRDLSNRQRLSQRPGTSKLIGSALFNAPVQYLGQVSSPLDPATLPIGTTQINDNFAYALGRLDQNSGGNWIDDDSSSNMFTILGKTSFAGSTATVISGSPAGVFNNQATNNVACQYAGSYQLAKSYSISATFTGVTAGATCTIFLRRNPALSSPNRFIVVNVQSSASAASSSINDDTGSALTSTVTGSFTSATIKVTVIGNQITVYKDAVQIMQTTTTNGVGNLGLGFVEPANLVNFRVTNFTVLTIDPKAIYRATNLLAVCNGNIYEGDLTTLPLITSGAGLLDPTVDVSFAYSAGFGYFVDGTSIIKVDLINKAKLTYAATTGTAPTLCTLACMWRDRLVLAAPIATPQNFFMSRVGTHTDWDYSQTDSAAAFAGNASKAGHIGDPILALIPLSDDVLLIGGDHSLWAIHGDPSDGGSIDLISDSIGILGPQAWTKAPDGTVYFLGTGGLYRIGSNGGLPQNIGNDEWNDYFRQIDRGRNYTRLAWDRDNQGCFVFVTPFVSGTTTHLWYDHRLDGFWPVQYPINHGPISVLVYDGDGPNDRVMLLGGRTGLIQKVNADKDDDGTAITSFIFLGPYKVSDVTESTLEWADVILGEPVGNFVAGDFNVTVAFQAGQTVEKAYASPLRTRSKTYTTPRRQSRLLQRIAGNVFFVKLSNSTLAKTWVLEKIVGMFMGGGLVRRR